MVERTEEMGNLLVTVANVYPKDKSASFHVTSFIKIVNDKIISLDEYWADDSDAPQWRLDNHIGTVIKCEPDRDGDLRLFYKKKTPKTPPPNSTLHSFYIIFIYNIFTQFIYSILKLSGTLSAYSMNTI